MNENADTPGLVYKVVELSTVSDETIEAALNEWTAQGWCFESIHFAMREASKRPAMAFLNFTRGSEGAGELPIDPARSGSQKV